MVSDAHRPCCSLDDGDLGSSSSSIPKESFTLILDGGEAPAKCADIFEQIVQRDAVWQAAWETVAANGLPKNLSRTRGCIIAVRIYELFTDMPL